MIKSLSIVLPIFNEARSLEHVISAWHTHLNQISVNHEFVLCEDGSTDGTKQLIDILIQRYPCIDQRSPSRRGYGGGVTAGILASTKDHVLFIDSDGQCMPDSVNSFLFSEHLESVQIGIRSPRRDPLIRKIYSFLFKIYFRLLFGSDIVDPSCPYIIAPKNHLTTLMPYMTYMREGYWWGFVGACKKKGLKLVQHKVLHYPRYDGSTVVYKPSKMPSIIFRNVYKLLLLKIAP
jgi:glycosyltransferase involved in cell wall biosynthesis